MKILSKILTLLLAVFISSISLFAQTNCYTNASMEGTSQSHVAPAPWNTCWGSPDTQPGQWGITQPASNGSTYVSFLATNNYGYLEGMTQPLTTCMIAGETYTFTVDLCHTNTYNTAEPGTCYSSLAVWGGNNACHRGELLYCSGEIWNTSWQSYTITFTPTQDWCYIGFSPCFLTSCSGYINLMMDNISCIAPVNSLVTSTDVTCFGYCDGTATVDPTSGTPPFTYLWSTGATTQTITGLCPGTYGVTVTDIGGSTDSDTTTVAEPALLVLSLAINTTPCTGLSTGSITASATGDDSPFSYVWAPGGQTTPTISNLSTGSYFATVTDTSGCVDTASILLPALPLPPANAGPDINLCIGFQADLSASGGTSYEWSTGAATSAISVTPLVTTTYTVTVTGANGCTATDDVVVNVNTLPPASAGTDQIICLGNTANFTASGGTIYIWSNNAATANINVSPVVSTTYSVTVTDDNGCSATDDVYLTVNPLPPAAAGTDAQICYGDNTPLNATGGTGYLWNPPTGLSDINISNPIASPTVTTTYTVVVTDANGCTEDDDVTVTVIPLPLANAGTDTEICEGEDASLTAGGGGSYLWSTGDNISTIVQSPPITTTYFVTVSDINGCSQTDDVVITVHYPPSANAGADIDICYGTDSILIATGGTQYHWSPSTGLNNPNVSNPVASPISPTTYTVTVTDINGCSATDDVAVGIYPAPVISFGSDITEGCEPLTIQFSDNTTPQIQTWIWNFDDPLSTSNTSSLPNPSHVFAHPGSYNITLTVFTTSGCTDTYSIPNMITVFPNPDAHFMYSPSVTTIENPIITFNDESTLATSWTWNFGEEQTGNSNHSIEENPIHEYQAEGEYFVTLFVMTNNGCIDSTSSTVIIKPIFTFYVPNVFTPDGDGLNDYFKGYGTNISEFEMHIFNRWGELVFHTDDYNEEWDGRIKGKEGTCMQDVYVYNIILKDINGKPYRYVGHVTLLK